MAFSVALLSLNAFTINVYAQQRGGPATSGAATGGPANSGATNCYATCNFYGGSATSGPATGGAASEGGNSNNNAGSVNSGSSYNNLPSQTTTETKFVTYNTPDLRLTIQTPAQWQGPTSCQTNYSGGAIHLKTSNCSSTWVPDIPNAQFGVNRVFSINPSNRDMDLDGKAKEIKHSLTDRYVNPNIIDVLGTNKGTINGAYPAYFFRTTQRNPTDGSTDSVLSVLVGTPDYMPWVDIHFSANQSEYDQLMPIVQKILNSVTELNGANGNSVQS